MSDPYLLTPVGRPGKCGTHAGWNVHTKRREKPCDECRAARAAYMREYRRRNPECRAREGRLAAARTRALSRLVDEHPDRYRELYAEEVARG